MGGRRKLVVTDPEAWRDHAACHDADPDLFFPVGETGPALDDIAAAKRICNGCPVQSPCLEYGISHSFDNGIWGGHTADERRLLRRRRTRAAARARNTTAPTRKATP